MASFKNTMGISSISFKQNIQCLCPLGGAFCTYQVSVDMSPGKTIPDYCEVGTKLRGLAGTKMTIEDCISRVSDYLVEAYRPYSLSVTVYCDDAVHFPVTVSKTTLNVNWKEFNKTYEKV